MADLDFDLPSRPPRGERMIGPAPVLSAASAWSSVPLFEKYKDDVGTRIRVQWQDPTTGYFNEMGHIASNCGIDELLFNFPRPGTFRLYVESTDGIQLSDEPVPLKIDPDHMSLKRAREANAAASTSAHAPSSGGGDGGASAAVMAMIAEERRRLDDERAQLRAEAERVREERMGATALLTERSGTFTAEMMAAQARLSESSLTSTTSSFQNMLLMQQQAAAAAQDRDRANQDAMMQRERLANEAFMQRMQAQAEQERMRIEALATESRLRMESEIQRAEQRLASEKMRLDADAVERRAMVEREDKLRREAAEAEASRQRDHFERMAKLEGEKRDPLATTMTTVMGLVGMGEKLGFDIKGLLGGLGGAGAAAGFGQTLIGEIGQTIRAVVTAQAAQAAAPDEEEEVEEEVEEAPALTDDQALVNVRFSDGSVRQMTMAQARQMQQQQQAAQPTPQQAQIPQIPAQPAQPAQTTQPAADPFNIVPFNPHAASPQPVQQPQAPVVVPPPNVPPPPSPATAVLPAADLKRARAAGRSLVAKLAAEPEATWLVSIMAALTETPALKTYIGAVTLQGALAEISTDPALAARILALVDQSGMVEKTTIYKAGNA